MIAVIVSVTLTAAALGFATQETRLMDISQQRLELSQVGRAAIALLAEDIRKAGAGIGYDESGVFQGIMADSFTAGGLNWNGSGIPIPAAATAPLPTGVFRTNTFTRPRPGMTQNQAYNVITHDIGFRYADGGYATITQESGYSGRMCDEDINGSMFEDGELVILRDFSGISALSGLITVQVNAIGDCTCEPDCDDFTFVPTNDFRSGAGADTASFGFGEVQGGFKTVVWFVTEVDGEGQLRRAQFDADNLNCVDRATCGGLVADFAEAIYTQIWRWNGTTNAWEHAGQAPSTETTDRMRIDIELILRSESETFSRQFPAQAKLQVDTCMPGACNSDDRDGYIRTAYRTSVDVMNAGYMRLRSGGS